eukprot:scaffold327_cov237-Chaetoceros_neogracile.AAC.3
MISINKALILAFAILPTQTFAAVCSGNDNDASFKFFAGKKERSCTWFRFKEERRAEYCLESDVNTACKQTCGQCCEDDPLYEFVRNNGTPSNCAWVGENGKRINRYCVVEATKSRNGRSVRDACPKTCDYCQDEITSAPTGAPTKVVGTTAPTKLKAPTTKAPTTMPQASPSTGPTAVPTRPPSPMPSPFPTLRPTSEPSDTPSEMPSAGPSDAPSSLPSDEPSQVPTIVPSDAPSQIPTSVPSDAPSTLPSDEPSSGPSSMPSDQPSTNPSDQPSVEPSGLPSDTPTRTPSSEPSITPTNNPTASIKPSASPTGNPIGITDAPTTSPIKSPTKSPTMAPVVACVDDPAFTFTTPNTKLTKNCAYITKNDSKLEERQENVCDEPNVRSKCCAACSK